jgi:hypothetical protein
MLNILLIRRFHMPGTPSSTLTRMNPPKTQTQNKALSTLASQNKSQNKSPRPVLLPVQSTMPSIEILSINMPTISEDYAQRRKAPQPVRFPAPVISQTVAPVKATVPARRDLALLAAEDEDSRITGMTRSLHRRLLGLNLPHNQVLSVTLPLASMQAKSKVSPATQAQQPRIA